MIFWDVSDCDVDVFRLVQRGVKIEVLAIKCYKASIGLGECTVDEEFDKCSSDLVAVVPTSPG